MDRVRHWVVAGMMLARLGAATRQARSGNVLFVLPEDWQRRDENGITLLMAPQVAPGKWFELRLVPGEESTASPEQAVASHVDLIKQRYAVLEATPVATAKNPRGWLSASIALTVNAAASKGAPADLRFWIVYAARPAGRIEVLHAVSNDYDLYRQHAKTMERFIERMNYANLIVLANGKPRLTELLVSETTDFLEWLLDVPFTDGQRQTIRDGIIGVWKAEDPKEIDATLEMVKLRRQLAAVEPAQAEFARARVQPDFIADMRKDESGLARLLVEVYDSGHQPIAEGTPPLTRQSADAMLEIVYFMAAVPEGNSSILPTSEEKDLWARKLAERYPSMPDQQKEQVARMPMVWAALRYSWPTLSGAQREELQAQFARVESVQQVRQSIAAARKAADESFAGAMKRMQRSHESFMMLSNLSATMHMGNMAMISNIGGGGWRYEYRYR